MDQPLLSRPLQVRHIAVFNNVNAIQSLTMLSTGGTVASRVATPFTSSGLIHRPHPTQRAPLSGSTSGQSEDIVLYRIAGLTCQTKLT